MSPQLDFFGIVVSDMARSVAFYRLLGLEFPEGAETESHVEAPLPGGLRYALDTEEVMRSFDPEWQRPAGGHAVGGAFRCDSPDEVNRVYEDLLAAGATEHKAPWDAFWGHALRAAERPGRHRDRSVRAAPGAVAVASQPARAASSRSTSSSFVHQPHDARSQPVPGSSRTTTPAS